MTDQLDHLLDQIDRLDQQATKGPWTVKDGFAHHIIGKEDYITECEECTGQVMEERDAAFTALARTALPKLSKALRTVLDVCSAMERGVGYRKSGDHDTWDSYHEGKHDMAMDIEEIITETLGDFDAS